jgi:hypothetical protein
MAVAQTLTVTGVATVTADLVVNGGDVTGTAGTATNVFRTTTAKVSLGGRAVDISNPGYATTILGTLNADQAVSCDTTLTVAQTLTVTGVATLSNTLNLGAHIVATNTGSAKSVSNSTANDLYTCVNNKRKGIDASGEKRREERQRESVRLHTHTHTRAYMMNPFIDSGHDYGRRYDW